MSSSTGLGGEDGSGDSGTDETPEALSTHLVLSDPPTVQEFANAVVDALLARRPLLAAIWPSLPPSQAATITPTRLRERCRFVSRVMAGFGREDEEARARAMAAELAMQRQIDALGAEESADLDDAEVAARVCEAAAVEYGAAQEREIVDQVIAEIARWRRELGPVEAAWLGAEAASRGVAWEDALRLAQRRGLHVPEVGTVSARAASTPSAPPAARDVLFDQTGPRPTARTRERGLRFGSWDDVRGRYAVGSVHDGRVACARSFGTVVELEPGVDGIIQASDRDDHPGEELAEGDEVRVRVVGVDRRRRRIELTTRLEGALEEEPTQPLRPRIGMVTQARVVEHDSIGVWVQIESIAGKPGRALMLPGDTNTPRGTDLRKAIPVGTDVKVKIVGVDGGRVRVSIRAAIHDEERQAYRAYQQQQAERTDEQQQAAPSVGEKVSLGELIRRKLGPLP